MGSLVWAPLERQPPPLAALSARQVSGLVCPAAGASGSLWRLAGRPAWGAQIGAERARNMSRPAERLHSGLARAPAAPAAAQRAPTADAKPGARLGSARFARRSLGLNYKAGSTLSLFRLVRAVAAWTKRAAALARIANLNSQKTAAQLGAAIVLIRRFCQIRPTGRPPPLPL